VREKGRGRELEREGDTRHTNPSLLPAPLLLYRGPHVTPCNRFSNSSSAGCREINEEFERLLVCMCAMTALVERGYRRGVTIRAAPYDFRYAPHSQLSYFTELRHLAENTWAINSRRKVVLLAHSMGGLYAAYFLSRQTGAWKERYIEAVVTVNTPWAGLTRYSRYCMKNSASSGTTNLMLYTNVKHILF